MEIPKQLQDCWDEWEAAQADGTILYKLSRLVPKMQKAQKLAVLELYGSGEKPKHIGDFLGISKQRVEQILNPDANTARVAVKKAVTNGTLTRQPCRACGDPKSEAHHEDYSKPLEVVWLCKKHHAMADAERRARLTSPRG